MTLAGRVIVISPHLDDAVFSLGASIAASARNGGDITVLTVFAGDPLSERPAGDWDGRSGFSTEGEAARARRDEDRRACERVGARPVWLPFADAQYGDPPADEDLRGALAEAGEGADLVLVPGYPLEHPDHRRVLELVSRGFPTPVALYVEQPYAWRRGRERPQGPLRWMPLAASGRDRRTKRRALREYRSQMPLFGKLPLERIALYERRRGGETIALLRS